jgi:hypothetical protein
MGALPLLPVEHVHESQLDGHHEVLVHRHSEMHHAGDDVEHLDKQGRAFDHDDEHTITLSSSFTARSSYRSVPPVPAEVVLLASTPLIVTASPTVDYVERLIHGPPRAPSGLRAPPLSTRL